MSRETLARNTRSRTSGYFKPEAMLYSSYDVSFQASDDVPWA